MVGFKMIYTDFENIPHNFYNVIVADPPWSYSNKYIKSPNRTLHGMTGANAHYNTMTLEDICLMPVSNISTRNSILFLWVTTPLLDEGIITLRSWGFQYKTSLFWEKIKNLGMGHWFRGNMEQCLIGVRGNPKPFNCQRPNIIHAPVGKHSEKPEAFWNLIDPLVKDYPNKIELFSRKERENWDCFGNQVESINKDGWFE